MQAVPHILVVDDEPELCYAMGELLTAFGYAVTTSTSALQAASMVKREQFDLAVIDLMMPGMSGRELAPAIKNRNPAMPVIMLSAYPPEEMPGVDYIFKKPVDPNVLEALVAVALGLDN